MTKPILIPTENPNIYLKQWSSPSDDKAIYRAIDENRANFDAFGEHLSALYQRPRDVWFERRFMEEDGRLCLAIWNRDFVVGNLDLVLRGDTPNVGNWLGAWVDHRHEGLGYAALGAKALIHYIHDRPDLSNLVTSSVHADNAKSIALLDRLGFEKTGYQEGSQFFKDEYIRGEDTLVYQLDTSAVSKDLE